MFVWICPLHIFKQIWHDLWIYSKPKALWKQNRSLIPNLWGRHWRHSFSWKPSSSIVLNFFPHPLHTFVWEEFSCQDYAKYVADETYKLIEEVNQKTNKQVGTLWVRACLATPSSSSQSWKVTLDQFWSILFAQSLTIRQTWNRSVPTIKKLRWNAL